MRNRRDLDHPWYDAVWRAQHGDVWHLCEYLRSDEPLTQDDREWLASFIGQGRWKRQPKPGRPKITSITHKLFSRMPLAARQFRNEMKELRKRGEAYGRREEIIDKVAMEWDISPSVFRNYLKRG